MACGKRGEAGHWLRQNEGNLASAPVSTRGATYDWACIQAQQAAEKAVKSLLHTAGHWKILTNSVYELLQESLLWPVSRLEKVYLDSRQK
ncbi:MAG TPA: HEPN domain-containing protein [Methanoregulaceae archaeon]|nr:HEPN domain-containing protein [Methanoregulaceae archaeon]